MLANIIKSVASKLALSSNILRSTAVVRNYSDSFKDRETAAETVYVKKHQNQQLEAIAKKQHQEHPTKSEKEKPNTTIAVDKAQGIPPKAVKESAEKIFPAHATASRAAKPLGNREVAAEEKYFYDKDKELVWNIRKEKK